MRVVHNNLGLRTGKYEGKTSFASYHVFLLHFRWLWHKFHTGSDYAGPNSQIRIFDPPDQDQYYAQRLMYRLQKNPSPKNKTPYFFLLQRIPMVVCELITAIYWYPVRCNRIQNFPRILCICTFYWHTGYQSCVTGLAHRIPVWMRQWAKLPANIQDLITDQPWTT
jgi:hypothetical protein